MYSDHQYKEDLKFIEKTESMMKKKYELLAYVFGLIACLIAHVLYLILFSRYGIKEMAVFNVFSILFYAASIVLVLFVKEKVYLVYASIVEIILHASVATKYVGCRPDFLMFLLMLIPFAFLMPNKRKIIPFALMYICLFLYVLLRFIYHDVGNSVYDLEHEKAGSILFFINSIIGGAVLIYVTIIYSMLNRYTECKLRVQNEQLRIMATVDSLTELNNRHAMNSDLKTISEECAEAGESYVIGIGDIDDFKKVNDTFGHDNGDVVLSTIAGILRSSLPDNCKIARWGGEEFLFIIPKTDLEYGFKSAERLIKAVRENKFNIDDNEFSVTMTFGVCEGRPGDDVDKIISHADQRLYKGKNSGKNCAVCTD